MREVGKLAFVLLLMTVLATCALAEGDADQKTTDKAEQKPKSEDPGEGLSLAKGLALVGACLGAAIAAIGGGYSVGRIGSACIESIARQPEAASHMFAPMVVTAAMIEGGMLFAVLVCLLAVMRL